MQPDLVSLTVIAVVAVLAPIVADLPRRLRLPVVVFELLLGIVVGPQVLGLAGVDPFIDFLGDLGLALLFFLAGTEIDLARVRGRTAVVAGLGWAGSLALGAVAALALAAAGIVSATALVAVALATTALGVVIPALRDAGMADTPFGRMASAAGAAGELGPIVLIAVVLAVDSGHPGRALLLVAFGAVSVAAALAAVAVRPRRMARLVDETMHASGQLAVRMCILLVVALVLLAVEFGLDLVLGAFAAGMIVGLVLRGARAEEPLRSKLDGIGFGMLVPVFFITSGMEFDLDALLASPAALAELPLFLALLLVVRGLPALLARRDLGAGGAAALGLMSASTLPLIVAIAAIGVETGRLGSDTAASLVGAGMLSVLVFPALALAVHRRGPGVAAPGAPAGGPSA